MLDRLSLGDTEARASVTGPEEIREIAAAAQPADRRERARRDVEADVLSRGLETIDRVRTDLVSTVSHELRTPLTSIAGYLELLAGRPHGEDVAPAGDEMGAIRRNLDRLNELITNLLGLSPRRGDPALRRAGGPAQHRRRRWPATSG